MFGMFRAFFRLIGNMFRRGERRVQEAADNVYAGSVRGISDAYDDAADKLRKDILEFSGAVGALEMELENKRKRLQDLNSTETDRLELRDGALAKFESASSEEDKAKYEKMFAELDAEIHDIEEKQKQLEGAISESETTMKSYYTKLKELKAELDKLPQEKAEQMAEFIGNTKMIELNTRLQNLQTSFDRGPLEAVRAKNRELSGKAVVSQKLAGADKKTDMAELREAARQTSARSRMQEMLAARKAETAAKTGGGTEKVAAKEDRKEL